MHHVKSADGTTVSYDTYGSGPPLVLVHGGFSDHITNWQECKSLLAEALHQSTPSPDGTRRNHGHREVILSLDEAADVVAVLRQIRRAGLPARPLSMAQSARSTPPPSTPRASASSSFTSTSRHRRSAPEDVSHLETFAAREDWDGMVEAFMRHPPGPAGGDRRDQDDAVLGTWTQDAKATINDLRALLKHDYGVERFRSLSTPVQLMIGSESPRELYLTDALAAVLPDARITTLEGTAHEGMTMVPEQFVGRRLPVPARSASAQLADF